jgi:two-component system, LuxR family, response regulator FixJ
MALRPTVYIVDDDPMVAAMIERIAESLDLPTVRFESAEAFLDASGTATAGCIVCDVCLPGMSGLELQKQLAERELQLPLVLITGYGDIPMCVEAMRAGAFHFLAKPFGLREFQEVLTRAIAFDEKRRDQLERRLVISNRLSQLTEDERQTLDLILLGKQNKEIASELDVSLRTVQFRIASINRKMGVATRTALNNLVVTALAKPYDLCDELLESKSRSIRRFDPGTAPGALRQGNSQPGTLARS